MPLFVTTPSETVLKPDTTRVVVEKGRTAHDDLKTGIDGAMDLPMSIGAAAYEALLPDDLPTPILNAANQFIHQILVEHKQSRSYGIVMRHSRQLGQPTVPTIVLGFPNLTAVPAIYPRDPIAHIPVLLVRDRAVLVGTIPGTWRRHVNHSEKVGLSDISVGGKESMLEAGSFGGWLSTTDGNRLGLTCSHCLPGCLVGSIVASPSTTEITARLDNIIRYTDLGPENCRLPGSKERKTEVALLRSQYMELPDNHGVELQDGTRIKLVGPDLGILIAKQEHNSSILQYHNQRLRTHTRREFGLMAAIPQSRMDWAIFKGNDSRILGNFLISDDFAKERVTRLGDIEPGARVIKIGRTTGQTEGIVNGAAIQIWETGALTQEVVVISASGGTDTGCFATVGDSGSLVVSLGNPLEAVGLVIGMNETGISRWVAVTPLWAVIKDVERVIEEEVEFCGEV